VGAASPFWQLARSPAEVLLFTALGDDDAARFVESKLAGSGAQMYSARRGEPHTRDIVLITPDGERTIIVVREPLHPRRDDPLPWEELAACDAAYFTGQDHDTLRAARAASLLVVTARRSQALARSGVRADLVVGSAVDPRERGRLADYAVPPGALVLTDGARGGAIETAAGIERFSASPTPQPAVGAYGAGDSFAAALAWYVARGLPLREACERAGAHGAAVLRGIDPVAWQLPLE